MSTPGNPANPPAPAPSNGPPADPDPKTGTPPANPAPPAQPPADPPKDPAPKTGDDDTSARIKAMEEQLKSTGAERDNFKTILEKLGQVLNPEKSTDPAELAKQVSAKDEELAATKMELAVLRVAGEKGNDLLDSRKFLASIKGLEVGSEAFNAKVKEAADARPDPKNAGKTKSAGKDLTGGKPDTKEQLTREQLKGMSPEEIEKAESEGRLTALLSGKG